MKSLTGNTVKLSDFRGKVVLLNFWAPWCAPCKVEVPWLVDLYKQHQSTGLEVVGVAVQFDTVNKVATFVRERNVDYSVLLGNNAVADAYGGLHFLPETCAIGPDGRVIGSIVGIKSKAALEDLIKQGLASVSPSRTR